MDAGKLGKAVNACTNLSRKFQAFSVVAGMLEEFGDLEEQCKLLLKQRVALDEEHKGLLVRKIAAEEKTTRAENICNAAVALKEEVEANLKQRADEVLGEAKNTAKILVKIASDKEGESGRLLAMAKDELFAVKIRIGAATQTLDGLKREIAAIKARL